MILSPWDLKPVQSMAASLFFKHKRLMLMLPRQEGKTELGVRIAHAITSEVRTTSSLFLAKDKSSGKKATREKFMRLFDEKIFQINTEHIYLKKHPTSVIYTQSVDKEPDKIRGGTYHYIHWSEVAFSKIQTPYKIMDVYERIIQPTLKETDGYVLLESTANGKNGWYDIWENYEKYGFARLKVSYSQMLEWGLITQADFDKEVRQNHPDVFRQEFECEFISFKGATYPELSDWHLWPTMPPPQPWQRVIMAIDWGFSPSATAVLFGYVEEGEVRIFDELYLKQTLVSEIAQAIKQKFDQYGITDFVAVADHDPHRIEELNRLGIAASLVDKVNVLGNRLEIKEHLHFKKLRINPRLCLNTVRDLQAAVWDDKKEGELDYGQCTWGHFDCEAALRYLIRGLAKAEREKPVSNPHAMHDSMSTAAWNMERMGGNDQSWGDRW